jgi:predicted DNA-binding transcriptional regulator YafY
VEPYRLKFQEGHWFLQAYCLRWMTVVVPKNWTPA